MFLVEITRTDDGITVMPVYGLDAEIEGGRRGFVPITDDNAQEAVEQAIAKKTRGWWAAASWRFILETDVPSSRIFRGAWRSGPAGPVVDMLKARVIHMNRIRVARDAELIATDKALAVAEDTIPPDGLEITRLRTLRQTLRDIPQTFDLSGAATPDALDILWPTEIPR